MNAFTLLFGEEREKKKHLLVGTALVHVQIRAMAFATEHGLSCTILEIDGEEIPGPKRKENKAIFYYMDPPSPEEQMNVLQKALAKYSLSGNIVPVSEKFVRGHLKAVRLKKRFQGGRNDVDI